MRRSRANAMTKTRHKKCIKSHHRGPFSLGVAAQARTLRGESRILSLDDAALDLLARHLVLLLATVHDHALLTVVISNDRRFAVKSVPGLRRVPLFCHRDRDWPWHWQKAEG